MTEQFLTPFCSRVLCNLKYLHFSFSHNAVDNNNGNFDILRDLRPVVGMQNNAFLKYYVQNFMMCSCMFCIGPAVFQYILFYTLMLGGEICIFATFRHHGQV